MKTIRPLLAIVALFLTLAAARAAEVAARPTPAQAAKQLAAEPDSPAAATAFYQAWLSDISLKISNDPDGAEKKIAEMKKIIAAHKTGDAKVKETLDRSTSVLRGFDDRIRMARMTGDAVKAELKKHPADAKALTDFQNKFYTQLYSSARTKPEETGKQLTETLRFLDEMKSLAGDSRAKDFDRVIATFKRIESTIATGQKQNSLIGQPAAPLSVTAWANGAPLTDASLKGRVVLLDFWAVWCGPCIATFPHLREWNEKFKDKGLTIIGLTRYYNYAWKDGKAARDKETVAPEKELEMLGHFAKEHKLGHVFGVQDERGLSDFYGVTGIPQAVLIDRQGKVRLIRVGSGDANAHDIGEMIEKLLAEGE
ncbi:MAG: TlpA family protein disulfide reductase [Verrucomicrobia bacterium]|nr:TlpA family protein disulfide reductase [Verrucomicrobiota bacterium]